MGEQPGLALLAVGGFGRGQLHPHSDIDLLILFEAGELRADQQAGDRAFVMLLWDAGFYLGHSVRNLAQCQDEAAQDVATATSLMEARLLAGRQVSAGCPAGETSRPTVCGRPRIFSDAKLRRAATSATSSTVKRPITSSPISRRARAGLRDIQMIDWVARRHFRWHATAQPGGAWLSDRE